MDYKLIALDIDGTLTNSQKEITPRTRYALMEAQKQGKKIILASGRHPVGIMPIAKDLMLDRFGGFIMAFNGGRIINCETGETMVSKLFPLEYLPDIVNVLKDSIYHESINSGTIGNINILATRESQANNKTYKKLVALYRDPAVQKWIKNQYHGTKVEVKKPVSYLEGK